MNQLSQSDKKLFILGVGAQRSGTTWLHAQLNRCDSVDMGFTKEYHIFTNRKRNLRGEWRRHKRNQERLRQALGSTKRLSHEEFLHLSTEEKQLLMRIRHHHYFDYFNKLVEKNSAISATGDISPYYAKLKAETLRYIRKRLVQKGFKVKIIFLMRDPIERILSQLNLIWRDQIQAPICHQTDPDLALATYFNTSGIERHSRYEKTLSAIDSAFPKEDTFIEFHERLFTLDTHHRLTEFLGLKLPTPEFKTIINSAPGPRAQNQQLLQDVARYYKSTYKYCQDRFGQDVNTLWPYTKLL